MGERDLAPDRRVLDDAAETVHLRTRDPRAALADAVRARRQHVFLEGGPTLAARVPAGRAGRRGRRVRRPDAARRRPRGGRRPRHRHDRRRVPPRVTDVTVLDRHDGDATPTSASRFHPRPSRPRPPGGPDVHRHRRGARHRQRDRRPGRRRSGSPSRRRTVLEDATLGDSIAVNGCCLTVVSTDGTPATRWTADVMQETLDKTVAAGRRPGRPGQPRARGHRRQAAGRPHRPGPRRRRRRRSSHADPQRALGGRRDRAPARPGPVPRRQGLDHRRRRQPHRRRPAARRHLHGQPDPRDPRPHHARLPAAR